MSCWVASTDHTILVAAAYVGMTTNCYDKATGKFDLGGLNLRRVRDVAIELNVENVKSFNHRYAHRNMDAESDTIAFSDALIKRLLEGRPLLGILQLRNSLAYNSCEHDAWEASNAKKMLDELETAILKELGRESVPDEELLPYEWSI